MGSMLGGQLAADRGGSLWLASRCPVMLLEWEISVAPLIAVHSLPAALLFSAIAGLGVAPMLSCQFSLVGALAPLGTTTEAFTWHRAATVGGIAGGSAVGGALVDAAGVIVDFV